MFQPSNQKNTVEGVQVTNQPTPEQFVQAQLFAMRNGFAGMAMQALIQVGHSADPTVIAKKSIEYAEQLMKEILGADNQANTENN